MPGRFWLASMALVGCLAAAPVARAQPGSVSDEDVGKAIERLVKWFYDNQGADGTWEALYKYGGRYEKPNEGGMTAMATLALIYAGESALWLADQDDPIITGKGLTGGDDASSVAYRRWTAWFVTQIGTLPKLAAYYRNNRPAVILAYHDLSLGLLDVRHWGVSGYAPESARRIFANIVLAAHSAGGTPASPSTAPSPGAGGGRKP